MNFTVKSYPPWPWGHRGHIGPQTGSVWPKSVSEGTRGSTVKAVQGYFKKQKSYFKSGKKVDLVCN